MVITTKFFKKLTRIGAMAVVLLSAPTGAQAHSRGIGEIDVQIGSDRSETAGSTSVSRNLRLGIFGGLVTSWQETDRISFGGFLKSDRGQKTIGSYNSYDVGLFLGWSRGSLSLRMAYTVFGELKGMNSFVETAWREASGYEMLLRWITWSTETEGNHEFALGPSLSYERVSYKKSQVGSLPESSQELLKEALVPGISFVFNY